MVTHFVLATGIDLPKGPKGAYQSRDKKKAQGKKGVDLSSVFFSLLAGNELAQLA